MQEETKQCQNCKNAFTIDATDFAFYDKIKVPPPTWCPECRMRRRFTFYNLNRIFKRRENLTGGKILSTFSDFFRGKVYEVSYWWSDNWDPMEYGREYDFTKPFFAQLESLMLEVPLPSRSIVNLIDSDYSANATGLKNCYMLFNAQRDENCLYSISIMDSKECADSHLLFSSELCYDCFMVGDSYKTLYSSNCFNCQEVYFSKDLRNCNRCFGCVGLRNKKFCIFNEQFSQEGYEEKIKEFNLGSF